MKQLCVQISSLETDELQIVKNLQGLIPAAPPNVTGI